MTITKEQIEFLNRINSGAQKAGLGDLMAEIESKSGGGDTKEVLNAFREELDEILELISGLENKINALGTEDKYSKSISAVESSVSTLSSKLDQHIKSTKKEVAEVVSAPAPPAPSASE